MMMAFAGEPVNCELLEMSLVGSKGARYGEGGAFDSQLRLEIHDATCMTAPSSTLLSDWCASSRVRRRNPLRMKQDWTLKTSHCNIVIELMSRAEMT